ncbi:MAG: redoxin domain-containing protein [Candidatus Bathyarchaeia archaeon]|nr:redoxin domain-containing protein [Candidatus Bathyarchaeota archaeon]
MRPKLRFQEVVPYLNLPSNKGTDVNLWNFKQRKNLVIIFHHGRSCINCRNKLKELSKVYREIQSLEAEVVAVSLDNLEDSEIQGEEDELPFPLLSDRYGVNSEKYTYIDKSRGTLFPAVFITDRFGALRHQKIAEEATDLPEAVEILSELLLIQVECPECSHL